MGDIHRGNQITCLVHKIGLQQAVVTSDYITIYTYFYERSEKKKQLRGTQNQPEPNVTTIAVDHRTFHRIIEVLLTVAISRINHLVIS